MISDRTLVVTGCDAVHFDLASELLESLHDLPERPFDIGFVCVGETQPPQDIRDRADLVASVEDTAFRLSGCDGYVLAYLGIKPRLPDFFPGYGAYVWLDADTWVQDLAGIEAFAQAAETADIAVHPECDLNYVSEPRPSQRTLTIYRRLFPDLDTDAISRFAMINAGVFAAKAASPVWTTWREILESLRRRSETDPDLYFSDQIPLHALIFTRQISIATLSAVNNWQLYTMPPQIDLGRGRLVSPLPPFEDIRILHLSGTTKQTLYRPDGSAGEMTFRYRDIKTFMARGAGAG